MAKAAWRYMLYDTRIRKMEKGLQETGPNVGGQQRQLWMVHGTGPDGEQSGLEQGEREGSRGKLQREKIGGTFLVLLYLEKSLINLDILVRNK